MTVRSKEVEARRGAVWPWRIGCVLGIAVCACVGTSVQAEWANGRGQAHVRHSDWWDTDTISSASLPVGTQVPLTLYVDLFASDAKAIANPEHLPCGPNHWDCAFGDASFCPDGLCFDGGNHSALVWTHVDDAPPDVQLTWASDHDYSAQSEPSGVPEPATFALVAVAALVSLIRRRPRGD